MIVPNLNTCSASRPLFRVIPIIAIISLLAAAVFAPNTEARRGGWEGIPPVELGTAGNYKLLAGAAITAPGSTIYGKIGAEAAITIPGTVVKWSIEAGAALTPANKVNSYSNDVSTALMDAQIAYEQARAVTSTTAVNITTDLAGRVLGPGLYHAPGALSLGGSTEHLTLDGRHVAASVWIFRSTAAMVVAASRRVILINSANYNRVFWVVDGAVTVGANAVIRGHVISKAAITTGANTEVHGSLLSLDAAITVGAGSVIQ